MRRRGRAGGQPVGGRVGLVPGEAAAAAGQEARDGRFVRCQVQQRFLVGHQPWVIFLTSRNSTESLSPAIWPIGPLVRHVVPAVGQHVGVVGAVGHLEVVHRGHAHARGRVLRRDLRPVWALRRDREAHLHRDEAYRPGGPGLLLDRHFIPFRTSCPYGFRC